MTASKEGDFQFV